MRKIITLLVLSVISITVISGQTSKSKKDFTGKWSFAAPAAPDGFTAGNIEIALGEGKYSSTISFPGNDYKIPGDKTKVENDTLTFSVVIEGNEVNIILKPENDLKMTGKAIYFEGEIPLVLTKDAPKM